MPDETIPPPARRAVYRHRLPTRIWHWINAIALTLLLMSGLQIFNAHPALYWGQAGSEYDRPALKISAANGEGRLQIGDLSFNTTGVLGLSAGMNGGTEARAFPAWATVPGFRALSLGRRWHFFFAWVLVVNLAIYAAFSLANGHFRKDLLPRRAELSPRHLLHEVWNHARLRFAKGDAALRYNILQLLAYASVIFVALPLIIATGLTMSPSFNATAPWLLDVFGGRQSARTLHFICASYLVFFVIIHLASLLAVGVWNELRSMITGRFVVTTPKGAAK
jgi:thiosulfate reductase cytochrome b subunit